MLRPLWPSSIALVLVLGCGGSPGGTQADAASPTPPATPDAEPNDEGAAAARAGGDEAAAGAEPRPPGPPAGPGGADELPRLEGSDDAALLAEFGEPTAKKTFTMGECCNELEIELNNTYPPNEGHDDVEIQQWDWDYDGYTLTVWLHRVDDAWRVLETSRYSDDVEF